ncbi:SREBP regulating gene protein isoform X1 [Anolis sagrei]|uniref:SREBP regulating gene protein isoform X1 n=1 Tax=Anolis sagrei TaxID=38937 RepID=UPI0035220D9F
MVQLLGLVWRRLLRKRWVLGVVFGLSLVYFLSSTFKQEDRVLWDRNIPQAQDEDHPIAWKVQFSPGNGSQQGNQCRNSVQGKLLITDELGYICERKDVLVNGCCNVDAPGTKLYSCDSCLSNGCCSVYEACVSCCLQPNKSLHLGSVVDLSILALMALVRMACSWAARIRSSFVSFFRVPFVSHSHVFSLSICLSIFPKNSPWRAFFCQFSLLL